MSTRKITIEVEIDGGGTIIDAGHVAHGLRNAVRGYKWHEGQEDEWALADHLQRMTVGVEKTEDM